MNWKSRRPSAALLLAALVTVPRAQAPTVRIDAGEVRGTTLDTDGVAVRAFLGVPFAAPPVGALRWRPPQPVAPWAGVRECTAFAPACPQPADLAYGTRFERQSEDCLYLNVWTAATDAADRRPVMVWIHGGGNLIGGAGSPIYDGRHLAADGVVLVSIQYRLGALGYLAHPALTAEAEALDDHASSGDYGLLDQIAALQWVHRNIARFGGDPGCVTIFGESAGAANVTYLMASPLAAGLFHRAIAESGYFGERVPQLDATGGSGTPPAHESGRAFAARLHIEGDGADALAALRAKTDLELLEVPTTIGGVSIGGVNIGGERPFRFGPVVDGWVLPRPPEEVWSAGEMAKVPLIAGSLLDDGSVFSRSNLFRRVAGYRLTVRTLFGADADRVFELFPAASDADVEGAVHRLITAAAFRAPARRLVRWMDAAGGDAWLYLFSRNPGKGRARHEGVFHGLEVGYVFGTLTAFGDATDREISMEMRRAWVRFARSGDPNDPTDGEPVWPRYDADGDRHLEIGDTLRAGSALDRKACDLMDAVARRR